MAIATNTTSTTTTPAPPPAAGLDAQQVWRNTAGNTNFNASASWNGGSGPAPVAGDVAAFTAAAVAQPVLNSTTNIAGLFFSGTGTSGYTLTNASGQTLTLTATGTSIGTETGNTNSVAIGAQNTTGTNTISVPVILGASSGSTQTFMQASGGTLVVNGVISGTINTLQILGTSTSSGGTITLNGANTFNVSAGQMTIDNGITLKLGNATALGNAANSIFVGANNNNATLDLNGQSVGSYALDITGQGVGGNGVLVNSSATAASYSGNIVTHSDPTVGGTGTITLSGVLSNGNSGSSSFHKFGTGTLILTNTNTMGRPIDLAGGTLQLGNGGTTGSLPNNGGQITDNANFTIDRSNAVTQGTDFTSNAITGSGSFTQLGTGTTTLNAANTYTGLTTVSAGILNIQNATALGTTAAGTTVSSGATLQIQGGITVGAEALTINGAGATGATGALENVSGTNTYGGAITLGSASTISSDAGTLTLSGNIGGSGLALTLAGAGSGTVSGIIGTGTGTLTRTGTGGIWTLSGANTYTGGTTINSGVLQLSGSGTLGSTSGSLTVNGGALDLHGTNQGVGNLTGTGGLIYNNLASTNSTLTIGNGNATGGDYMGSIIAAAGTLALTKTGTGALTLSGSNSYTGATTISAGTLQLGDGGTGGQLTATSTITDNGNLTINRSNAATQSTDFNSAITGTGSFTQLGTGTTTLNVANSYSGGTTVTAGTLKMSGSGTLGSTSGTLTVNGGTLDLNGTSQTAGALNGSGGTINTSTGSSTLTVGNGGGTGSHAGTIANGSGTVALTKTGAGTETLTGANTYTGATNVNGGSLFINGNQSAATGAVTVNNSGTTLGGSGTIGGSVTVNSGANLAPGATGTGSNAKLNTGALTLASMSNFKVDITGAGETLGTPNSPNAGITYDQANVTGTVNVTGSNLALTVSGLTATNIGQNFFIVANDGVDAITGTFAGLANLSTFNVGADVFAIHYSADTSTGLLVNGNDIALTLIAVPEPSTWLAAALALGAVGCMQRRRLRGLVRRS